MGNLFRSRKGVRKMKYVFLLVAILSLGMVSCNSLSGNDLPGTQAEKGRGTTTEGGLEAHESKGGHLLERHVNVTDQDLTQRLQSQKKISGASRFKDRETAERVAQAVLSDKENQKKIETWLENHNNRRNLVLSYHGGRDEVLGRGLRRGDTQVQDMKQSAILVLKKDHQGDYYILTGYPNQY